MPTTPMKNLIYRAALPVLSPSTHKRYRHETAGQPLTHLPYYEHLLVRHHVAGSSLLLRDSDRAAQVYTSCTRPAHHAGPDTLYRVASITKTATALAVLTACDDGLFELDTPAARLLPDGDRSPALRGVTVRHLLCHTSGLRDISAVDEALRSGATFHDVLAADGIRSGEPGTTMVYCNFGFGLLGCLLEHTLGQSLEAIFQSRLFQPLGMRATLDGTTLDEQRVMPIARMLPYRAGQDVTIPALGRKPLTAPDPLRRFGHTAGAMYTDAPSLSRLLTLIAQGGELNGQRLISEALIREMTTRQASTSTRTYGLGLVLLERPELSERRLLGHQGFAYGCVDGAFFEEGTGRQVIFLNGGASEARTGRLGLVNRDVLKWALRKEIPSWT
ncbi:MAG: beta-lactamase family protein [Christensenellaceae bacterium]|nr:beta-lactamase family protein [Christensenellaceae bacterium]